METYSYKGISILPNLTKATTYLIFLTENSDFATDVWNDLLKLIGKKNEIIGDPIYDENRNEFKIQVKTIKNVESAMKICKDEPQFETANFYINGENFKFKYLRSPTSISIDGKTFKTVGEFTLPKSVYQQFLNM